MGGSSLWDQVWLTLLIGIAIQIIVAALWFLSVRLWKCFFEIQTAAGGGAQDHALPEVGATADANTVIDSEMRNSFGSPEGGESVAQPDLEMATENGGECPRAQVSESATRGAIVPAEVGVPQQTKADE